MGMAKNGRIIVNLMYNYLKKNFINWQNVQVNLLVNLFTKF